MTNATVDTDGTGDYSNAALAIADISATPSDDWTLAATATAGTPDTSSPDFSNDWSVYRLIVNADDTYWLEAASQYAYPCTVSSDNVQINGLQVGTDYRTAFTITGAGNHLDRCLATQMSGGGGDLYGFYCDGDGNVVANSKAHGFTLAGFFGFASTTYFYNDTSINNGTGFEQQDYRYVTCVNCYGGASTGDDYTEGLLPERFVRTTSASSDATGSVGLTAIACSTSAGAYFTNVTAGSEDLHIASASSDLIGVATDMSADAVYPYDWDYDGVTRSSWDVGAYEYVSAGGISIPVVHSHLVQQGVQS